jgi:hypothetical protein
MLTNTSNTTTITGKSSSLKRDVGIKLLDAQEQSASPKEAKRKRREHEKEALKKIKYEQIEREKLEKDKLKTATISGGVSYESQNSLMNSEKIDRSLLCEDTSLVSKMHQTKLPFVDNTSFDSNELSGNQQKISNLRQNNSLYQPNIINDLSVSDQENGKDYINILQQQNEKQFTSLYEQNSYNDILQPQKFNNNSIQQHQHQIVSNHDTISNFSNKIIINRENNNIGNFSNVNFDLYAQNDSISVSGNFENQNSNINLNVNNEPNSFSSTPLSTFTTTSSISQLPSSSNPTSNDSNKIHTNNQSLNLTVLIN